MLLIFFSIIIIIDEPLKSLDVDPKKILRIKYLKNLVKLSIKYLFYFLSERKTLISPIIELKFDRFSTIPIHGFRMLI